MPKTHHVPGSFCWFELATTDHGAAKNFYSSVFGWDVNDTPMGTGEVYTIFKIDGQDVAAGYAMRPEQRAQGMPPSWMVYVLVKSADEAAARAKQLGAAVHVEPFNVMDHGRMSVIQDPTGATFSVWQSMKHTGTGITAVDGTVTWADLSTTDQVTAGPFYSDLFNWKMVDGESMNPAAPGTYYHIVNGKEMIGGVRPSEHHPAGVPSNWVVYFQVADCDATIAKTKSLGGRVVMPAMTMEDVRRFAVLSDAQGAVFAIVQELAAPKAKPAPAAKAAPKAAPAAKAPAAKAAVKAPAPKAKPALTVKPAPKPKPAAKAKAKKPARKAKPAARKAGKAKASKKAKPARRSGKVRKAGRAKK